MKPARCFFIFCTVFLIGSLLIFPKEMLQASAASVNLWFCQVLPSLFPFMVATGILIRMGAADAMGQILQPLMKPLFGISGVCSFPFFMGLISGYPMGAKITVSLYEEKMISLEDAQRVLSFCNNPGPLFVIGTTGTALLKNPILGYFMMLCIFLGAVTTGILYRPNIQKSKNAPVLISANKKNTDAFGTVLGKSIADAVETILQVGGFIILFGVLIEALQITGISHMLALVVSSLLPITQGTFYGIFGGFLEMTNGLSLLSQTVTSPSAGFIACCTAILGFGGLSILGQTLGILAAIPVKTGKYIAAKAVNAVFSGAYAYLLFPVFEKKLLCAVPVFSPSAPVLPLWTMNTLPSILFLCIVVIWALKIHRNYRL